MLRAAQNPDALLAEIRVILQGGRPNVPKDPALVSQALTDLRLAGTTRPTGKAIRAFVQGAKVEQEPKPAREPRTYGNGRATPPPAPTPKSHEPYRDPYADRRPGGLTVSLQDLIKKPGVVPS